MVVVPNADIPLWCDHSFLGPDSQDGQLWFITAQFPQRIFNLEEFVLTQNFTDFLSEVQKSVFIPRKKNKFNDLVVLIR